MAATQHKTDVAIIGAGPVGLFAVFECGMLGLECHLIDSLDVVGGQCAALYPEQPIYDIPGTAKLMAGELVARLSEQVAPFKAVHHLGQQVTALTPTSAGWRLETSKGTAIEARAVILAAGAGAFGPNRPPLAHIEDYEGRSVFYMVARREDFRDRRVVIAGGGDSALDWVLSLAEVARKVYVVHRRPKFRGAPETVARMQELAAAGERVEIVVPYVLHGLEGQDGTPDAGGGATLKGATRRRAGARRGPAPLQGRASARRCPGCGATLRRRRAPGSNRGEAAAALRARPDPGGRWCRRRGKPARRPRARSPAPGPRSTRMSAARIVSSSCSTTITVLPRSRIAVSVSSNLRLSR